MKVQLCLLMHKSIDILFFQLDVYVATKTSLQKMLIADFTWKPSRTWGDGKSKTIASLHRELKEGSSTLRIDEKKHLGRKWNGKR